MKHAELIAIEQKAAQELPQRWVAKVFALVTEVRRLRHEAEMACQEPYDECECPGCITADERGGA